MSDQRRSAPPADDGVMTVDAAIVTPSRRGRLQFARHGEARWHQGSVYDAAGVLIPHARRAGGIAGDHLHSLDQEWVDPALVRPTLPGTYYYGGPWMQHFGHFLLETIPTLWAHDGDSTVLFHRLGDSQSYKLELLRLAGVTDHVFVHGACEVARLIVPSRPVALNAWCTPAAVGLWSRMGERAAAEAEGAGGRRVWFSRTRVEAEPAGANRVLGSPNMDQIFEDLGFEVVYPEQMPIVEQLALARDADVLAGFEGSALHLSAFSRGNARVLMLGTRNRPRGNRAQSTIDSAVGNTTVIVPFETLNRPRESIAHALD